MSQIKEKILLPLSFIIASISSNLFALDPYDNIPAPEGLYFLNYAVNANANHFNDQNGNVSDNNMNFDLSQNVFRVAYYGKSSSKKSFVANVAVPLGRISLKDDTDSGLGDITVASGYWVIDDNKAKTWVSLGLLTILPTGNFDKNKTANMGNNVYQIRPFLDVAKKIGKFQIESTIRYNMYTKNKDTNLKKGSEVLFETFLGYNFSDNNLIGLHLNTTSGENNKSSGNVVVNSGLTRHQVGGSYLYNFNKGPTLSLEYFKDLKAKNTLDTQVSLMRLSWKL